MNRKVIATFIITIIAIIFLWLYSFGFLSGLRTAKVNPVSLKPVPEQSFNVYHNKDLAENFYTIKFPIYWQLGLQNKVGSYQLIFNKGNASSELQDVADNTTLELFVLSQDEPNLKKTLTNYSRLDYQKLSVNSNDAYQLSYQSTENGKIYETIKTYITGQDHAAVITLSNPQENSTELQPVFLSVINSFHWENNK